LAFLKFALVFLIIYVALRLVFRFVGKAILAWLGKKLLQRVQRSFESRTGFSGNDPFEAPPEQAAQEQKQQSSQPLEKKTVGEYIDFEEID
jgi:uncharacterized membrane protein